MDGSSVQGINNMCVCDFVQACLCEWVGERGQRGRRGGVLLSGICVDSASQHNVLTSSVKKNNK